MNDQLIEKVIKTNNIPCPDFVFANPLLDKNVAIALSKSFVKMLTTSKLTSKVHNNLRHTVLNNVRNICKIEPENHLTVREDITRVLTDSYMENINIISENEEYIEKQLDRFLIRHMKELNLSPKTTSVHNPEIIQALMNLSPSDTEIICKNILSWRQNNKSLKTLSSLWTGELRHEVYEDLSIKIKSVIEKDMLGIIHFIITTRDFNINSIFDYEDISVILKQLIARCSVSHNCFQVCSGILNYLFITMNFNPRVQAFIELFVKNIKQSCTKTTFSVLYPTHLSLIALLLDIDINNLPETIKSKYVDMVINHLHNIHDKTENDLIMLLSHFPQWFEVYFVVKEL